MFILTQLIAIESVELNVLIWYIEMILVYVVVVFFVVVIE